MPFNMYAHAFQADWLDAQYNALRGVEVAQVFGEWRRRSDAALATGPWQLDLSYGATVAESLDLLLPPDRPARGMMVFIHGGFWRGSDKAVHRFVAPSFAQAGYAVALLNYGLCPQVTLKTIVTQIVRARDWLTAQMVSWGLADSPVVMAGHSAGGHLAAMLSAEAWAGGKSVWPSLSLSGLHDLAPLAQAPFLSADLGLTPADVHELSPVHHQPAASARIAVMVGAAESEEFLRQSQLLRQAWGTTAVTGCEQVPATTHFGMVQAMADPHSTVHARVLSLFDGTLR